jgi:hypothetical protein
MPRRKHQLFLQTTNTVFHGRMAIVTGFKYTIKSNKKAFDLSFPSFEVDGKKSQTVLKNLKVIKPASTLKNGSSQYELEGTFLNEPALLLKIVFQIAPDNAVLRFQYSLRTTKALVLTKGSGKDNISYASFKNGNSKIKEVRLSEFNERFHATHRSEYVLAERYFENEASFMGPIAVGTDGQTSYLAAYEHGSQYPDRFLQFQLNRDNRIAIASVKGNYLNGQPADGFTSIWLEFAGVNGNEDDLAGEYRSFVLHYLTQNKESRKPYIFYNTWGRQERVQWNGSEISYFDEPKANDGGNRPGA